jgi:hypothetical protein
MYWQLLIAAFVPFVPVEPTVVRAYDTPKFRLVFECTGFETLFEFTRELVRENRGIIKTMWGQLRLFYSESVADRQLVEKDS